MWPDSAQEGNTNVENPRQVVTSIGQGHRPDAPESSSSRRPLAISGFKSSVPSWVRRLRR